MVQLKFRLSNMIPNAWFYKHRDMGAQGHGGVGMHRRSSSARWSREFVQQPSRNRVSSVRWNWNREVDVCWHPAEVVEQPVTPTKGSSHSPLPRRASYYYSTRDREVPLAPRAKKAQSPTRSSRRRNKVGHAPEGRRHVSATVRVHGKEPVVDAPVSSCRRRDMCLQNGGAEEPGRPTMAGPPDGINVKVIASENEIIIDLRDASERALRPIVTRPARRHPEPDELDGSHVDLADVTVRDKDTPERRLRPIATRPARRLPELNELDGSHVYLAGVTVRGEDTPERRLRPIATRPVRRLRELNKPEDSHVDHADVTARASSASEKSSISKPRRSSASLTSGRRRLKTRVNSSRLAVTARRGKPQARNWTPPIIADRYVVVKQSRDPRKDFRESMEEMIRAKRIRDAGELEDLLACYLSLNDAEHHDLIIEVFEQIWMNLARRC